jgi:uncharacterized protein YfaA (DUF2138 family)
VSPPLAAKKQRQKAFERLAARSAARVDALLHAVTLAQLAADELDVKALRDVLTAELESAIYHSRRAEGDSHQLALDQSRQGRKQVDLLAGW